MNAYFFKSDISNTIYFTLLLKDVSPVRKILRIIFTHDTGETDSIAVNTKEMDKWQLTISDAIKKST